MKVLKTQYQDQVGMFKSLYENNNGFFLLQDNLSCQVRKSSHQQLSNLQTLKKKCNKWMDTLSLHQSLKPMWLLDNLSNPLHYSHHG
jgi:hypothetical protein